MTTRVKLYPLREREFFSGIICGARIAGLIRLPAVHNLLVHRVFRRLYVELTDDAAVYGMELMFLVLLHQFHGDSETVQSGLESLFMCELEVRSGSPGSIWIRLNPQGARAMLSSERPFRDRPARYRELFLEYGRRFKVYLESGNQPAERVYLGDIIARILEEAGVRISSHNASAIDRRLAAILPQIQDEAALHNLDVYFDPARPHPDSDPQLPAQLRTGLTMMSIASSVSLLDFLTVADYHPLRSDQVPGSAGMYRRLAAAYQKN